VEKSNHFINQKAEENLLANVVLLLNMNQILEMKDYYHKFLVEKLPQGSVFSAKTPRCVITAYTSGKVLFQGADSAAEADRWGGESAAVTSSGSAPSRAKGNVPPGIGSMSAIGSDEVGTGDFFGPITVVAAYVMKEQIPLLKELGVRDSKDLNDEKIAAIAKDIKNVVTFSLLTLKNEKYNQLQRSGMSQGKMKAILHNQAILNVLEKISPEVPEAVLIDQFVEKDTYYRHLQGQKAVARENVYFSTKAEGVHIAVAAASILARYAFVQYMDKLGEAAGITIPKGAGAHVDEAAAKLILSKGREVLPGFVKMHFANTEKALRIVEKKRKG
jgi:ribonuclease HIII